MGLGSAQRLRRRKDFDAVFRGGRKVVEHRLVLWMLPRADDGPSRLGLSVSRKVGGAVTRNRVKRVLRVAWAHEAGALPDIPVDAVLLARPGRAPRDLAEAERSLRKLVARARGEDRPRSGHRSRSGSRRRARRDPP